MSNGRQWILYDERACAKQSTDRACVYVACESEKEAITYKGDYGNMAAYSYAITASGELVDERWEWDYYE